jgi:hypothetical protein
MKETVRRAGPMSCLISGKEQRSIPNQELLPLIARNINIAALLRKLRMCSYREEAPESFYLLGVGAIGIAIFHGVSSNTFLRILCCYLQGLFVKFVSLLTHPKDIITEIIRK